MMDKMQNKPDALPRSNNIPKSGKSPRIHSVSGDLQSNAVTE